MTLMQDGTVLIVGGIDTPTAAEIYDPVAGVFTPIASTPTSRSLVLAFLARIPEPISTIPRPAASRRPARCRSVVPFTLQLCWGTAES